MSRIVIAFKEAANVRCIVRELSSFNIDVCEGNVLNAYKVTWVLAGTGILAAAVSGCAITPRLAVPEALASEARVSGDLRGIRYWGDAPPTDYKGLVSEIIRQRQTSGDRSFRRGGAPSFSFLILSGGGDAGAYGAGLLNGWTDRGTRPKFDVVTGVSTGALIAPFAFLGSKYDGQLKKVYTAHKAEDYYTAQPLQGILGGPAFADNQPLFQLIVRYANKRLIDEVAREHNKGRRLFVQTTNLDAQRPVIWDMGAIANYRSPRARDLFRRVLLASAAIPLVFPPVKIKVMVGGKFYEEMHVDGGTVSQQAGLSAWTLNTIDVAKRFKLQPRRTTYIVRNNIVGPEWENVDNSAVKIAARAASTTIKYQGNADLYMDFLAAQKRGIDFNATAIGRDFPAKYVGPFNQQYMTKLYQYGYQKARHGRPWFKSPTKLLQAGISSN